MSEKTEGKMKRERKIILFFLFFAFLIRIISANLLFDIEKIPPNDGYDQIAINLIQGKGFIENDFYRSQRPPLYPYFLSLVYRCFGHGFLPVIIVQSIVGALVCLFIYLLATCVFDKTTGILAAAISAIYPPLIFHSIQLATEPFYIFFLLLFAFFFIKALRTSETKYMVFSGIFLGFSSLTRAQGLSFFLYVIITFLIVFKFNIRRSIKPACIILFGAFLIILPWSIRNFIIHRHIVPIVIQSGKIFYESNNPLIVDDPVNWGRNLAVEDLPGYEKSAGLTEYQRDKLFLKLGFDFIRKNPNKVPKLLFNKFIRFWNIFPNISLPWRIIYFLTFGLLLPFMMAGAIKSMWSKNYCALALIFIIVWVNISALIFWAGARMRIPASPYILILGVYGVIQMCRRLNLPILSVIKDS